MKKKILTGLACLLLFGVAYAKTKKPTPIAKQTNTTPEQPLPGEWRYGELRKSESGWMRCESGTDKCALIIKKVAVDLPTTGYYLYLNTSQTSGETVIKKYDVEDILFDRDENGEVIFKTVPPIELN
ncbi:MAG: hypothetical protein V4538_13190 [Bacteroidota bacterium]